MTSQTPSDTPRLKIGTDYVANQVIVKFKEGIETSGISSLQESCNATCLKMADNTGLELWQLNGMSVEEAIATYSNDSRIAYIEPNYRISVEGTPDDPSYDSLWGLNNTGQTGGTPDADIDAPEAWDIETGTDVLIGVIDTGIDYTHPDLVDNIWTNPGEVAGDGIDNDNNGYVDDVHGYDFFNNDGDPFDDNGHGTHVAGTIAADGDNSIGVTGVNWSAQLVGIKFLGAGGYGDTFGAIQAVEYATTIGVQITNNSWGGGGYSQALNDAIAAAGEAGQLFIAAAGNDYGNNNDSYPHYPSNYDLDNVISVAATDHNDLLADFSNYGPTTVHLGAPGDSVYSTLPGNSYGTYSGTSMATPHVTGVAALLWAQDPTRTADQVKNRLLASVDPLPALSGITVSGGRLNAFRALAEAGKGAIRGSKWNDKDADGVRDANEVGLANWTIYLDENQNGVFDTAVSTISSSGTPQAIADIATTNFTLNVSGLSGTIQDLNLSLDISHTWDEDLDVFLISPSGTRIELFSDVGGSDDATNDNFTNTTLDDEAAIAITNGTAPFTGSFRPVDSLSAFAHEDPNGTWTLEITDDSKRDIGTLNNWSLNFTTASETFTLTDANGDYAFNGLNPETYTVAEVVKPGWEQTFPSGSGSHTVTVEADATLEDVDFGNRDVTIGLIKGSKWEDKDGDSVRDAGESGLSGWTIYLDQNQNGAIDEGEVSTVTDANGEYTFFDLQPGTYTVTEVQQPGWVQTVAPSAVDLDAGEIASGVDFANQPLPGEISGTKWNDVDGDGERDEGEAGLQGWTIYLDQNQNGAIDDSEASTVTDANGNYEFTNLHYGNYTVAEVLQPGWQQTYPGGSFESGDFTGWDTLGNTSIQTADFGSGPTEGDYQALITTGSTFSDTDLENFLGLTFGSLDGLGNGDATQGSAIKRTITVSAGQQLTFDWNFLTSENTPSFYNDFAFVSISSESSNTLANTNSSFVSSFTIFPQETGFNTFSYSFTTGGTYIFGIGVVDVGDSAVDSAVLVDNFPAGGSSNFVGSHKININPGQSVGNINFGNQEIAPGQIQGSKWNDLDGDGVRAEGESGLANWTIFLDTDIDGVLDGDETFTTTDANGNYSFTGLNSGTYTVAEVLQDGWLQTFPTAPGTYTVDVSNNQVVTGIDFGNQVLVPGEIRGSKWNDLDGNRIWDEGEQGLAGWTIYLDQNQNGQLDEDEVSTVTDANGDYAFTGLNLGYYTIAEVQQVGWAQTFPGGSTESVQDEPNDTIPQAISSGLISSNPATFLSSGYIGDNSNVSYLTDVDFIKLQLNAGDYVTIDIDASEFGSSLDSILRLFDSAGNQLAANDDYNGLDSFIGFTAYSFDTYYVGVSGYSNFYYDPFVEGSGSGGSTGSYDINISVNGGDGSSSFNFHTVQLANGQIVEGLNFGNQQLLPGEIRGSQWHDNNGDGVRDASETGLSGWTLFLDANDDGVLNTGEVSTTTDANGNYAFTNVYLGTYTVAEVLQEGWEPTYPDYGGVNNNQTVEVGNGQIVEGIDFGNRLSIQTLNGTAGNNNLTGRTPGRDIINGFAGKDTLNGGGDNDTLYGGTGDDSLSGNDQDDALFGEDGKDKLYGNSGNDYLDGGNNLDTLTGGDGNDSLLGESDNDKLYGELGDDFLNGGSGKDLLSGGDDNDTLLGESEADTLEGGNGNDLLDGGSDQDKLEGANGDDTLLGGTENDNLNGGIGNDSLSGDIGEDQLQGHDGNDTLVGGTSNDTLYGGNGIDILIGVDPNSELAGSGEIDRLQGDAGNDTFVLGDSIAAYYNDGKSPYAGLDDYALISGFKVGQDVIQLHGSASDYVLGSSPFSGNKDTIIFLKTDEVDEYIGLVKSVKVSQLNLDSSSFSYV